MDERGCNMPATRVRFGAKAVLSYVILDANLLSRVSRSCCCRGNCGVSYQNRGFHVDKLDLESERAK
jgi:hypothetical protein